MNCPGCTWAGERLASEAEWEKAAHGGSFDDQDHTLRAAYRWYSELNYQSLIIGFRCAASPLH